MSVTVTLDGFFATVLTAVFAVLKLTGVIDWSWLWVLSPIWISAALFVVILLVLLAIYLFPGRRR